MTVRYKELQELRLTIQNMKDRARDAGQENIESALTCASLNVKVASEGALNEGRPGVQTSERKYASLRETKGTEIRRKQENLLDPIERKR
jgi:hypothetical protein